MKVVHYSHSLTRSAGGVFFAVAGMAGAQRRAGIDAVAVGWGDEHLVEDRVRWGDVPLRHLHRGAAGYGLSSAMFSHIRRQQPDLLHVHGIWSAASIYGRIAAALGIPLVVSPHGMLDPWIVARRPWVKAVHAALFERPMLRKAHVHVLNEAERDGVLAFMPGLAGRIFVAPNGVDGAAAAAPDGPRRGTLFLGRLHPKKQVIELIDRWRTHPALTHERLEIAGWGDDGYTALVADRARNVPNIEFVGPLFGEEKDAAFRRARHFILPSLSEGLPMAVLEAIQLGCIPVITDQCNLPELFDDGIALRMATDFSDFDAVIADAIALPEAEARRLSAAAAAYAARYLWSNIAAKMADQYERILAGRT